MSATLLRDIEDFEQAIRSLKGAPQDEAARKAICIASRYVWVATKSTFLFCSEAMNADMARRILDAFEEAEKALCADAPEGEEDDYCLNVRDRLSGPEGIRDALLAVMNREGARV